MLMSDSTGGISPTPSNNPTPPTSGPTSSPSNSNPFMDGSLDNIKAKNMTQFKQALIKSMGPEKGEKFYKLFINSMAQSSFLMMKQAASNADKATKQMNQGSS